MNNDYIFLPHELEHLSYLKDNAAECALFLKKDESFPLKEATKITLIGNGVRHTIIGGTGSGAVNVRYKENVEEAFLNAGFEILSEDWLDKYDKVYEQNQIDNIKRIKKEAKELHVMAASYAFGINARESEYEFPILGDHEVAIYVLSRNAGEGADRRLEKGDVYLTDSEIRDILILNRTYKKFMLVLNVPGVVDLTPIMEVNNILLISQLGSLTGDILVNIVLGKLNPSGKLTTTWASVKDYPYINTPIDADECLYKEGIYVGYRYFESAKKDVLFPFGFGLGYSPFEYKVVDISNLKDKITLKVNVTNKGLLPGKEVIQAYISGPSIRPSLELVAFKKTNLIEPKKSEEIELSFSLNEFPRYDESLQAYVLDKGNYVLRVGNSSKNLKDITNIVLNDNVIIRQVKNVFNKPPFEDLKIDRIPYKGNTSFPNISLTKDDFISTKVEYTGKYKIEIPEEVKRLTTDELILLCLGDYKTGVEGIIGQSCSLVLGGAGETTLRVEALKDALSMVDGPAGLRLIREYIVNSKGAYPTVSDSIMDVIKNYIPKPIAYFISPKRNLKKKGSVVIQIATAIPIATALAQSFSEDFISGCGRLVKEEMEIYGVDIWLAPALNIHRSILCGRNFEYYSEDPLVSAFAASLITKAVQENKNKAVTVKHFACNNQETNRTNNNSIVSERAMREIYLLGFEKTIKWSSPLSIMTSYNLVNGIHASEHSGLIVDILRNEWGYKGLIMTDWINSGQVYRKGNKYPAAFASHNVKNGTDISMPGNKVDIKNIKYALKNGYLSREDLKLPAAIVYNFVKTLKSE